MHRPRRGLMALVVLATIGAAADARAQQRLEPVEIPYRFEHQGFQPTLNLVFELDLARILACPKPIIFEGPTNRLGQQGFHSLLPVVE